MYKVKQTLAFKTWIEGIRDVSVRIRLKRRLDKAEQGNLGDIKSVGEGIVEMREHFGSGWRMYYVTQGKTIIVMLGGGDKSTQAADIKAVKKLLADLGD